MKLHVNAQLKLKVADLTKIWLEPDFWLLSDTESDIPNPDYLNRWPKVAYHATSEKCAKSLLINGKEEKFDYPMYLSFDPGVSKHYFRFIENPVLLEVDIKPIIELLKEDNRQIEMDPNNGADSFQFWGVLPARCFTMVE